MIRGGLRTRFIADSTRVMVIAGLSRLGWFDATVHDTPPGVRRHQPLRYLPRALKWDETVEPNAIGVSSEDMISLDAGLGGEIEDSLRMYIDIFAQGDELGWHIAQDVRDILIGKMPDIGRSAPTIDVFDLRLATPAVFTQVDVEGLLIDRAHSESREWRNRWFMVRFDLADEYYDEMSGFNLDPLEWSGDLDLVWKQVQAIEQSG